ncbi:dihydrolipoyl dehydrogenase family protein, partial [Halolamina litorea]
MVVGDVTTGTEVLVVGAGPGGYVAAIRAAQNGLDTTLVDRDAYGGTCLNYGCIPSKALISATDVAHDARNAEEMGVYADPLIRADEMQEWKAGVVDQLTSGVEKLCKANGVNLIEGEATFVDDSTARIAHGGEGQGSESIEFEHAIVATGSRPIQIPGFEYADDPVWSSRDALDVEEPPEKLLVVGAGYIGMELSTVFAKMGVDVTVVEMLDGILPGYEDDVSRVVKKRADDLGIDFNFGEAASEWVEDGDGIVVTTEDEDGEESTYDADKVLVAVGRQPVSESLDPEAAGVEVDEHGFIATDDQARTNVDNIYAVGDVAGEPMLAHKASKEGI